MPDRTNRPKTEGENTRFELRAFQTWPTEIFRELCLRDAEYAFFSNLTKWLNELSTDLKKLEKWVK